MRPSSRMAGTGGRKLGSTTFLSPGNALSPATGQLILNSTTVKDTCRVWVSQVDLGSTGTAENQTSYDEELSCDTGPVPAPRTIDLFKRYGPFVPLSSEGCLGMISASTAALLTARFPYVTPSGAVGTLSRPEHDADGDQRPVLAANPAGRRWLHRKHRVWRPSPTWPTIGSHWCASTTGPRCGSTRARPNP